MKESTALSPERREAHPPEAHSIASPISRGESKLSGVESARGIAAIDGIATV